MPAQSVGHFLKRWGFTPQKPIQRAYEQRPAEVKAWLDHEYAVIAASANEEGVKIPLADETGLRSDDVRARGYAPEGQTPLIRVCTKSESHPLINAGIAKPRAVRHSNWPVDNAQPIRATHPESYAQEIPRTPRLRASTSRADASGTAIHRPGG